MTTNSLEEFRQEYLDIVNGKLDTNFEKTELLIFIAGARFQAINLRELGITLNFDLAAHIHYRKL